MKKPVLLFLLPVFCSLTLLQSPAEAKKVNNFASLKAGIYSPIDNSRFDDGFAGTIAFGEYTSENFTWGIELSNMNSSFEGTVNGVAEEDDLTIYSAKLALTWIKPMGKKIRRTRKKRFELFFNLNGGVYFVDIESTIAGISDKDSDQVYGLEAGLGGRYNFAKKFFVGLEAIYIYTTDVTATLFSTQLPKFSLEGYTIQGVIGVRFNIFRIFRSR